MTWIFPINIVWASRSRQNLNLLDSELVRTRQTWLRNQEIKKSRNQEIKKSRNQEIKKSRNEEIKKWRNQEIKKSRKSRNQSSDLTSELVRLDSELVRTWIYLKLPFYSLWIVDSKYIFFIGSCKYPGRYFRFRLI